MGATKSELLEFSDLILRGMQIAYRKLVEETAAKDGYLIVSDNGKPKEVPAKDLLKKFRNVD